MSLASLALRIAVVEALKDATLAGGRIADSEIDELGSLISSEPAPIVVVSIDDADGERDKAGLALLDADDQVGLLFEVAVASKVSVTARDEEGSEEAIVIEPSSMGLEASLDFLWRQICRALLTPGAGPWSDLVRRLIMRTVRFQRKRGGDARGVRFASRYYLVTVELVSDPDFGVAAGELWDDLIVAMEAEPHLAGLARIIRAEIERPDGIARWRADQARLGLPEAEVRGLGIAPAYDGSPEEPPAFAGYQLFEAMVDASNVGTADELTG